MIRKAESNPWGVGLLIGALAGLTACGGGGGSSNSVPTANSGADQTVNGGVVTLTGSGSDSDGTITTYAWSQTGGPAVALSSTSTATTTFTAPVAPTDTTLTFSLVVTDNSGASSTADPVSIVVSGGVAVTGTIRFSRVPFIIAPAQGLDYNSEQLVAARDITVQAIESATQRVVNTGTTDSTGHYSVVVPRNTSLAIRPVAEMVRAAPTALPRWQFRVLDIETMTAPYTYTGATFSSGAAPSVQNVDIPSGWNAATRSPSGTRASAPFAVLDTIASARDLILSVSATAEFPPLRIDWAPTNLGFETFYDDNAGGDDRRIVLSGQANVDTDEFDQHVIAHEFGHYIDDRFSRSDSLGGPHAAGDVLDPRVAFSEGFGYAFGAIVLNDPLVRDSFGNLQMSESRFNIENDALTNEGWYSEGSVQEVLWDLFDGVNDDAVSLGFAPLWQVMISDQRSTQAITSIFPFIESLKAQTGQSAPIGTIVSNEMMTGLTMNAFATTESNAAGRPAGEVLPLYTNLTVGGPAETVRSLAAFGEDNKLSNHRFLRLDVGAAQSVRITAATATTGRDIDVAVFRQGVRVGSGEGNGNEDFTLNLQPGTYVLDTYDCGNAGCDDNSPAAVDISVQVVSN
jgi:hypothetical protein